MSVGLLGAFINILDRAGCGSCVLSNYTAFLQLSAQNRVPVLPNMTGYFFPGEYQQGSVYLNELLTALEILVFWTDAF